MVHNPLHRIKNLWMQLCAESSGIVHVNASMEYVDCSGKRRKFWRTGSIESLELDELKRIESMFLFYDDLQRWWVKRKAFESDERLLKRVLARLRKVKSRG
jgi:hypothetical protein